MKKHITAKAQKRRLRNRQREGRKVAKQLVEGEEGMSAEEVRVRAIERAAKAREELTQNDIRSSQFRG